MKRIVICCDGTWNQPDQGIPTNVTKLALAVANQGTDDAGDPVEQLVYYHPGVGTRRSERFRGGGFGLGLSRNIRDCYRFVVEHYEPRDELFVFGFSRGAYTARSLVGLIRNAGVLRARHVERIPDAYALYRGGGDARHPDGNEALLFRRSFSHPDVRVRFVGVWDTVGALGIPGVPKWLARGRWGFHDTTLSSFVDAAYQALAIDERRRPFGPTPWIQSPDAGTQRFEQLWFAGSHCDVGGGNADQSLSEVPLAWLVEKAHMEGLGLRRGHFVRCATPEPARRKRGEEMAPDPSGAMKNSMTPFYWLMLGPKRRELTVTDAAGRPQAKLALAAEQRHGDAGLAPRYAPPNLLHALAASPPLGVQAPAMVEERAAATGGPAAPAVASGAAVGAAGPPAA
jgi:uncharacterized protein (DUF2235 family)